MSTTTYFRWLENGEREEPEYEPYREFREAIKKAKGAFVVETVKKLQLAGQELKHWTALAWLLERRCPEEFGKKEVEILAQQQKQIDDIRSRINANAGTNGHGK